MPRKSGDGKGRLGGRKKGTPNKDKKTLQDKALELGKDPFEILCHFANGDWKALGYKSKTKKVSAGYGRIVEEERIDESLRLTAAKEACQYIHAKRKAVELSGKSEEAVEVTLYIPSNNREIKVRKSA